MASGNKPPYDGLARRRWQTGSVIQRGKYVKNWIGRYLFDEVQADGTIKRIHKSDVLGGIDEFPTKRTAKRELARILADINAENYRPRHRITIKQASEQYLKTVVPAFKPASRASVKSNMKIIVEHFGQLPVSALSLAHIQAWVAGLDKSPKTVANYITSFQMLWKHCRAWEYVTGDPFEFLILPRADLREPASFSPEQIREIIERAPEPYSLMFWLTAETGIRGGELCGLFRQDIDIENRMIYVKRSAFQGQLQMPKTTNAVRAFPISAFLAEHIRQYTVSVHPDLKRQDGTTHDVPRQDETRLLFKTARGKVCDNGNLVKRGLKPILRAMGIDGKGVGLHALRHSNASAMDAMNAPLSVRTARLGHGSMKTTMKYTHAVSEDQRRVADALGALYNPVRQPK